MNDSTAATTYVGQLAEDIAPGLADLAEVINLYVVGWHDFGYAEPPAPECKAIPPLGERSADAIRYGHDAIKEIDKLTRQLYALREQLAGELRQDEDIRAARVDAMLAERRPDQRAAALAQRMTRKSGGAR